jgi:hypothetical protein
MEKRFARCEMPHRTKRIKPGDIRMAKTRNRNQNIGAFNRGDIEQMRTQLAAIEDEWLKSRAEGNLEISEQLIDDSYEGITSNGSPQTKAEFLQAISRLADPQSRAEHAERNIRVHGALALSTGLASVYAAERSHSFRYLRVFRNTDGKWRLIASQSTRVREA